MSTRVRRQRPSRPTGIRPGRDGARRVLAPTKSQERLVDTVGFALFIGWIALAFTTKNPDQFALPKLLGLFAYTTFLAIVWIHDLRRGRVHTIPRALALATLACACWWVVTSLTAQQVNTAVFGLRGRYNGVATMLAGMALFVFLATTRFSDREIDRRIAMICVALTAASAYALVQAAGLDPVPFQDGRPASTLAHPVIFGGVLAITLPFTLCFAINASSRLARFSWSAAGIAQALALLLTLARGPWVAALCGSAVFAFLTSRERTALGLRLAGLAALTLLVMAALLSFSVRTRSSVRNRVATVTSLPDDSSIRYRAHFCRAALGMLRDHPLFGVGLENYGLLYPIYRSSPTDTIAPDLVPTMVHSGPLQTAVSGGILALVLQVSFLVVVGLNVARRRRVEPDGHQRLMGAAFLASGTAYFVQDLSGWPHVALGAIAFAIWGLGVSWSLGRQAQVLSGPRLALVFLGAGLMVGCAWLTRDTWRRFRAETLMFEAARLDIGTSWRSVEAKLQAALDVSPDRACVNGEAARLYLRRVTLAGGRRTYERGVELANAALAANPFDPYTRLDRAKLDIAAINHGLVFGLSDAGRDALASARSMTAGSAAVHQVEASLSRLTGVSILWIEPSETAGYGPPGSLTVAGHASRHLAGTHVLLHWRNLTRRSEWVAGDLVFVTKGNGDWYASIPAAKASERYEVYSTSEASSFGPCTYLGRGSINLCTPVAIIAPDKRGGGPPGSLIVAGSVREMGPGTEVFLNWRDATRQSNRGVLALSGETAKAVSFPLGAPGNWYAIIPNSGPSDRYEAYISSPSKVTEPCRYLGDGAGTLCSPITWIQPQATAGFGPPGSLVVAGAMPDGVARANVFLHWRNVTRHSEWTTERYAPMPDGNGVWTNFIPDATWTDQYQVSISSPIAASETCVYTADGSRNLCQ